MYIFPVSYTHLDVYKRQGVGCLKPYSHGVEVGYMIYPRYWRQEYGKQICYELMKIVETMTVQRIVAYIDPLNIPSKKILESYGFQSIYQKGDEELLEKKKNRITGYTGLYGIVANPIRHSFSPMMHNTASVSYTHLEQVKDQRLDLYHQKLPVVAQLHLLKMVI